MLTILVASVGGHLKQLYRLAPRISELGDEILWVTYRTSQSESLLAGRRVLYGPETESRDYRGVAANAWIAARLFRSHSGRTARVVSTGSAIALSFIPIARLHGVPCHYIESAARATRPSRTGELIAGSPESRSTRNTRAGRDRRGVTSVPCSTTSWPTRVWGRRAICVASW